MYIFDRDTVLTPAGSSVWAGRVTDRWSINQVPNGGYLLALLGNAMLQRSSKKTASILTANYLSRCVPGETRIICEPLAASTLFERIQARLIQGGVERLRAFGTFTEETDACFLSRYERSAPSVAPLEECLQVPEMPGYSLFEQMDVRLDPRCTGWMQGLPGDKSEMRGWITFKDGRPLDRAAVVLLADCFPRPY